MTSGTAPGGAPAPTPAVGAATAYRRAAEIRGGRRRRLAAVAAVVVVIAAVVIVLERPRPGPSSGTTGTPPSGGGGGGSNSTTGPIAVAFGSPESDPIVCGDGGSVPAEKVVWRGASVPLTTANVQLLVVEIADGDILPAVGFTPGVAPSDPCTGSAPAPSYHWYAVLADPTGVNVAYYTLSADWVVLGGAPNVTVAANSTLIVLITPSVAGTGYGLVAQGSADGRRIASEVPL